MFDCELTPRGTETRQGIVGIENNYTCKRCGRIVWSHRPPELTHIKCLVQEKVTSSSPHRKPKKDTQLTLAASLPGDLSCGHRGDKVSFQACGCKNPPQAFHCLSPDTRTTRCIIGGNEKDNTLAVDYDYLTCFDCPFRKPVNLLKEIASKVSPLKYPKYKLPNIIVIGLPHSGTTMLTQILVCFGFHLPKIVSEYVESPIVNEINDYLIDGKVWSLAMIRNLKLKSPWILKDTRFCSTLHYWIPWLSRDNAPKLLICLSREQEDIEASYLSRNEEVPNLSHLQRVCNEQFEQWPWNKIRIEYKQLIEACKLFTLPLDRYIFK